MATVAIIGRPNVGKSTLFNRIVGRRVAITLKEPGITRDRLVRTACWRGKEFQVIDTGGFVLASRDEIEREIARQIQIALEEAKVIVLVVDGTAGVMPLDEEIASALRRQGREFLLAINKCDVKSRFDPTDFYRLGVKKVFSISAEHGIGVDELLDEVIARLSEGTTLPGGGAVSQKKEEIALAILGRPNVGKSTFLNRLLGKERAIVMPTPGTTRDLVEDRFHFEETTFRVIDTAGIRRRQRIEEPVEFYSVRRAIGAIDLCDIALVLIDATEGPTAQDKRIIKLVENKNKGMVVVANKIDLVPKELEKKVKDYIKEKLHFVDYAPLIYTCALAGKGILDAIRQAKAVYHSGAMRVSSTFLRATILPELKNNPPTPHCRVSGLSQVGIRPPVFRLRVSHPSEVTPLYQRYLLNLIRNQFHFTGYPLRLKITR